MVSASSVPKGEGGGFTCVLPASGADRTVIQR